MTGLPQRSATALAPVRGSLLIWRTVVFNSAEVQVSETTVKSRSLSTVPAGINCVARVPATSRPATVSGDKVSVRRLALS